MQGWSDIEGPVRRARTGDHLLLHVKRTGAADWIEEDISVALRRFTYVGYLPGSAEYIAAICSRILTPLFCLVLGFWVAAVRVGDRAAWALLVLMLSVANLIIDSRTTYGHEDALQPFLTGLTGVFIRLGPLALVYFGIIFPETLVLDRKFPWIKWIAIAPMLLRAGLVGIVGGLALHHNAMAARLLRIVLAGEPAGAGIELGLIGLLFVILGYKTVTATTKGCAPALSSAGYKRRRWAAAALDNADVGGDSPHAVSRLAGAAFDRRVACVSHRDGLRDRGAPRYGCARGAAAGVAVPFGEERDPHSADCDQRWDYRAGRDNQRQLQRGDPGGTALGWLRAAGRTWRSRRAIAPLD